MQSSGTNLTLIRVYKDYKNYPLPFCNSIQESNNSVFDSRSCTHVLIQEKYLQVIKHKTLLILRKIETLRGVRFWIDQEKTRRRKHQDVCVQVMRKTSILGLLIYYTRLGPKGGYPPLADRILSPQKVIQLGLVKFVIFPIHCISGCIQTCWFNQLGCMSISSDE
jgi:hypothetical protein